MTTHEIDDIANILHGYESWKIAKMHAIENGSDNMLSVSAYIDELAQVRALDIINQIQAVYANPEFTWQEVDAEIRRLIGVE